MEGRASATEHEFFDLIEAAEAKGQLALVETFYIESKADAQKRTLELLPWRHLDLFGKSRDRAVREAAYTEKKRRSEYLYESGLCSKKALQDLKVSQSVRTSAAHQAKSSECLELYLAADRDANYIPELIELIDHYGISPNTKPDSLLTLAAYHPNLMKVILTNGFDVDVTADQFFDLFLQREDSPSGQVLHDSALLFLAAGGLPQSPTNLNRALALILHNPAVLSDVLLVALAEKDEALQKTLVPLRSQIVNTLQGLVQQTAPGQQERLYELWSIVDRTHLESIKGPQLVEVAQAAQMEGVLEKQAGLFGQLMKLAKEVDAYTQLTRLLATSQ